MKWTKEEEQQHLDYFDKHGVYMTSPHRSEGAVRRKMRTLLADREKQPPKEEKPDIAKELETFRKATDSGLCFFLDAVLFQEHTGHSLREIVNTRKYKKFLPTASRDFLIEGVQNDDLDGLAVLKALFGPEE